ncbi:MAG TPA: hypothetical protein VF773_21470 [Verrucomicrobiae bacterium]
MLTVPLAALTSAVVLGQGTVRFSTYDPARGVNAPVYIAGMAAGSIGLKAQLMYVSGTGANTFYTPLFPITIFNRGHTAAAGYVMVPQDPLVVPNVPAGQQAHIVLRAFDGYSYETSIVRGESPPVQVNLGGQFADGRVVEPAVLSSLQGFHILGMPRHIRIYGLSVEGNDLRFEVLSAAPGVWTNCVVETSTGVGGWTALRTNALSTTQFTNTFTIPYTRSEHARFYRVRTP